jgi:putative ABC transport system permease protein
VLSYNFWTRRFGSSPTVLGRWFNFRGEPVQIIGVAEKKFSGLVPGFVPDLWLPKQSASEYRGWELVWGYLKPGVRPEQARQALQAALTNFVREHPNLSPGGETNEQSLNYTNLRLDLVSAATGLKTWLPKQWARPLLILAVVATLVLLMACSNLANLLLAPAAVREGEMAMRISIGASRLRLIRQLLIESGLLAGAACILGLAFASATAPSIVNLLSASGQRAVYLDLHVDVRILALLASIGVSTTLLFGLAPALRASAVSPQQALKARSARQSGPIGILRPLLASQVGFSFIVLFVGGLLLTSFQKLTDVDLGFSKAGILLVDIRGKVPPGEKARLARFKLLDQIRRLPSVQAASMSDQGLVGGEYGEIITRDLRFPGREPESVKPLYMAVSPGFFETMRIRILDGRDFTERDVALGSAAVVVNQAFVHHYLPGRSVLGQSLEQVGGSPNTVQKEIVGVVRDAKYNNLWEENSPIIYGLLEGINAMLEVRTAGDPLAMARTIRHAIHDLNPALRVSSMMLQSTRIDNTLLRERLLALLSKFFAGVAVLLAAIGLYAVLSYSVVRRTKEIGIRIALGARQLGVIRLVISDIVLVVAMGLAAGMAGGLALGRFVAASLFEVKPSDFPSIALPLVCLLLAAGLTAVPPAFRAALVDPMVALREE